MLTTSYLEAGIRHKVNEAFEISSVIGHDRFNDFGEITSISATAAWWFNDSSSLSFGFGMDDDSDKSVSLGYRYTFGGRWLVKGERLVYRPREVEPACGTSERSEPQVGVI